MRSDIVTIEPQIVQFGRQNSQTIKVINNTSNTITNFFFCLYNVQKFTFTPDSFSLAPNQHKLITISLKIKSARSVAKEFAYLKSTQINKRITLLINQFQSPEIKNRPFQEGMEDINTLSSRQYRDVQTQAIQKIIKEKEAYIALLEKNNEGVNRNINFRTEQSGEKINIFKREVEQLQMKLVLSQNERQSVQKQNAILQNKFEEYRNYCEADLKNYQKINQQYKEKLEQNRKLIDQVAYLEQQGNQFLRKIQQKQQKIKQLQYMNQRTVDESRKQAQRKVKYVEDRLEQQKSIYQQSARYSQQKIKDLQKKIQLGQSFKQKNIYFERQIKRKQEQLRNLMVAFETQRSNMKELQVQKKKLIKFQMLNESVNQKNSELTSRLKQVQKVNQTLKEEIYVYKNKVSQNQNSSDKMNQYLEIALQSCRAENQALKRSKHEMEKSLDEFMHINRQSHDNNKSLNQQATKFKQEINLLIQIKDNLERRNEELKQEHHLAIMHLKTQNIELLQKLSLGETSKREDKMRKLEEEFQAKEKELVKVTFLLNQNNNRNEELLVQNAKLGERVKKYKKQAKKELRSINDTAINQLHKQHQQKKQMAKRIIQLEQVILNYSCDKARQQKSKKQDQREFETQINLDSNMGLKRQRASSRILGIKDQRRQIQYSQGSNTDAFNQLGQLRELNNYLKNEEDRFNKLFSLEEREENEDYDTRPIFRVIRFFKNLENKLRESKGDDNLVNIKQIEYLKGRIKQLEGIKEEKQNISSINLSKTRQHCSQLLQFVREQMKNQYKKLNETVKLWEQKYELLKKKIYEQYRSKIIEVLNKKQKNTISQLQTILQRFIDGMSNLSHKQAILHKQVKLKQNARKQNVQLKGKVTQLNFLLQTKKGYCSRDPVKLLYNETELEWQESLKRQAEFLTLTAEYQRLKQELQLVNQQLDDSRQQSKRYLKQLDQKSNEVLRLKKYQIQIQTNYEREIQKQYQIIEENKKRIMEVTKTSKETIKHLSKQKQYNNLRDNLQKQKQVIRQLRDKQKMMEELLEESHRSEQKERKKTNEQNRVVETMRDLKDNNRELRNQNAKIKERAAKLEEELEKKNAYLKSLREDLQQNRVRVQKKEEVEAQKLKEEVKRLQQELKKIRDQLEKCKRKKEKEVSQLKNEIDKLKNQNLITEKSLQSIIRALMDTIRKIYGRLKRLIKKKKGKDLQDNQKLFQNTQGLHINALKIDQIFEEALTIFEQND